MACSKESFLQKSDLIPFKGRRHILSNFYPCNIFYNGVWFNCSEQAYQYVKALYHERADIAKQILVTSSAADQKCCAKCITVKASWFDRRFFVMQDILVAKSECVPEYRSFLLQSSGVLVEAVYGDKYWSSGLSRSEVFQTDPLQWPGKNMLGILHMQLRENLKNVQELLRLKEKQMLSDATLAISFISVNTRELTVTIQAASEKDAYDFTDKYFVPRRIVQVFTHTSHQ